MHQILVHFFWDPVGFADERGRRLRDQLGLLIELQKMELEAGKLSAKEKDLPARMKSLEEEFTALCGAVEADREQLEALRRCRREKDSQLKAGQESLKRTRERLFEVKNNKEYQSMLKEIEAFEAKNGKIEDEIIALLDEMERAEAVVKAKDDELETQRLDFEAEKSKLALALDALAGELAECHRSSERIKKEIPPEILRKYQQIKGVGRGVAVVSVWKEICDGCHMSIPPQQYNELQKSNGLMTCPNCNRIIYWKARNE
jgi:predicted  nucleic acid-binding Zn-ribbon protein